MFCKLRMVASQTYLCQILFQSESEIIRDPEESAASTIIGFSELVIRKKSNIHQSIVYDSNVKNVKKFKKVGSVYKANF